MHICPNSLAELNYDGGGTDETFDQRVSEYRFLLPLSEKEMRRLCRQSIEDDCLFPLFVSLGINLPHLTAETISNYAAKYIDRRATELAQIDNGEVCLEFMNPRITYFANQVEKFILSETLKSSALNDEQTEQVYRLAFRMRFNEQHIENVGFNASERFEEFMPQIFSVAISRPAVAADLLERVSRVLFEIEAQELLKLHNGKAPNFDSNYSHLHQQTELERLLK